MRLKSDWSIPIFAIGVVLAIVCVAALVVSSLSPLGEAGALLVGVGIAWLLGLVGLAVLACLGFMRWLEERRHRPRRL